MPLSSLPRRSDLLINEQGLSPGAKRDGLRVISECNELRWASSPFRNFPEPGTMLEGLQVISKMQRSVLSLKRFCDMKSFYGNSPSNLELGSRMLSGTLLTTPKLSLGRCEAWTPVRCMGSPKAKEQPRGSLWRTRSVISRESSIINSTKSQLSRFALRYYSQLSLQPLSALSLPLSMN